MDENHNVYNYIPVGEQVCSDGTISVILAKSPSSCATSTYIDQQGSLHDTDLCQKKSYSLYD